MLHRVTKDRVAGTEGILTQERRFFNESFEIFEKGCKKGRIPMGPTLNVCVSIFFLLLFSRDNTKDN